MAAAATWQQPTMSDASDASERAQQNLDYQTFRPPRQRSVATRRTPRSANSTCCVTLRRAAVTSARSLRVLCSQGSSCPARLRARCERIATRHGRRCVAEQQAAKPAGAGRDPERATAEMYAQRPGSTWARACWRIAQLRCAHAPALLLALLILACAARPANGAKPFPPCAAARVSCACAGIACVRCARLCRLHPRRSCAAGPPRRRFQRVVSREKRLLDGRATAGCEYYTNCAACVADTTCGWCAHASRHQQRRSRAPAHGATHPHARLGAGVATTHTTPAVTASRCRVTTTCVRVVTRPVEEAPLTTCVHRPARRTSTRSPEPPPWAGA